MIHVCFTTYNRLDLLERALASLARCDPGPDSITIIDNGRQVKHLRFKDQTISFMPFPSRLPTPNFVDLRELLGPDGYPSASLAASWNWFLKHVPDTRLICHDDVLFAPDSLARLASTPGDYVIDRAKGCVIIRDALVQQIGYLDETISPGYYMYEDVDYGHRMALAGITPVWCDAGITHEPSQTWKRTSESAAATAEHHRRFLVAQANYVRKWGALPEFDPDGIAR